MQVKDIEDELTLMGHQTANQDVVDIFKNMDMVVKAQQASVNKIKLSFTVANVAVFFIAAIVTVFSFPHGEEQNWLIVFSIQLTLGGFLIAAVILMRCAIAQTNFASPNECLIYLHVLFFTTLILATLCLVYI